MPASAEGKTPVLLVDLARNFGGAEVRVMETARGLAQAGIPCAVAVLEGSALHGALGQRGLSLRPLALGRGDPRLFGALLRLIRKEGFAVVDAHNVQSYFWALPAARLAGCSRVLATVHSAFGHTETGLRRLAYERTLALACRLAEEVIAVSDSVQSYLQGLGVPSGRIRLIPNRLGLEAAQIPAAARSSFGWDAGHILIVAVGRLEPVKGLDHLLDALASVLPEEPRLRLLLVGQGRSRAELEQKAHSLGLGDRVAFAGFRTDVPALLAMADIYCIPSLSEGLPYALLEACAAGLPVVASSVGGMAGLLEDGRTALLVPPADARSLGGALLRLVRDPALSATMGDAARRLARSRSGSDEMLAETFDAYGLNRPNCREDA